MEPDLLADEIPLSEKKVHAAREARSPLIQVGWLFAMALLGFAATSAAIWFGPKAVEYLREVASRSSDIAPKSAPGTAPKFKPVWVSGNPPVIQPPSIPQFNIPQGSGFSAPYPGGGVGSSRFTIHR
jgi:hypothetical protein